MLIVAIFLLNLPFPLPLPSVLVLYEHVGWSDRRAVFGVGADTRGAGMQLHRYSLRRQKRTGVNSTKYPGIKYI